MRAAALLRLTELRRRGGLALLVIAGAAILVLAAGGGGYGLASDLAATLGYVAALLCGAFPLAIDRERRRSHLTGASPVAPWAWAAGSALGAGAAALVATLALFAAAGLGAAAAGGIETHVVYPLNAHGTIWLFGERSIGVPADAHALRTEVRAYFRAEDAVGAPGVVPLTVDGVEVRVPTDQAVSLKAKPPAVRLSNPDRTQTVGISADETLALGSERSFLWNALLAGVAPALAACGLAALGVAAGANLSAPVAALLAATFLLFASLKGFLLETWEHEGKIAAAVAGETHGHEGHEGHDHAPVSAAPHAAEAALRGLLRIVPDLPSLDATDRVARGEWVGAGPRRSRLAAAFAALAFACAGVVGGLGVLLRRAP